MNEGIKMRRAAIMIFLAITLAIPAPFASAAGDGRAESLEIAISKKDANDVIAGVRSAFKGSNAVDIKIITFEALFLKKKFSEAAKFIDEAAAEADKLSKNLPDAGYYREITKVYSVFMYYALEKPDGIQLDMFMKKTVPAIKTRIFAIFAERYASGLKKIADEMKNKKNNADFVSYLEAKCRETQSSEPESVFYSRAAAELETAMKTPALINFIAARPLFLLMLYKNVRNSGAAFQAEFLKRFAMKNLPASVIDDSGFGELKEKKAQGR